MAEQQARHGNRQHQPEVIPRLGIVWGHQRSGTSILRRVLGTHPQVQIMHELRAFRRVASQLADLSARAALGRPLMIEAATRLENPPRLE